MKAAVIFDLDGTLVDPAGAITGGIAAALKAHDIAVPEEQKLKSFIGPPLAASLQALPGVTEELVPRLIEHYRADYVREGMASSQVYLGMRRLLEDLWEQGISLAVATSKPQPQARQLLDIQGLLQVFAAVAGSDPNEAVPHTSKGPIIAAALEQLSLTPSSRSALPGIMAPVIMVGDRKFDVEGAARHSIPCIGVSWGYASEGELDEAGAEAVVDSAEQLQAEIRRRLPARPLPLPR